MVFWETIVPSKARFVPGIRTEGVTRKTRATNGGEGQYGKGWEAKTSSQWNCTWGRRGQQRRISRFGE